MRLARPLAARAVSAALLLCLSACARADVPRPSLGLYTPGDSPSPAITPAPGASSPSPSPSPSPSRADGGAPSPSPSATKPSPSPSAAKPSPSPSPPPLENLTLDRGSAVMERYDTLTLTPRFYPANAAGSVRFISSNSAVARVDGRGQVYAAASGSAVIRCVSGSLTAYCDITVVVSVTEVSVAVARAALAWEGGVQPPTYAVGELCAVSVAVAPADATDKAVSLAVSGARAETLGADTVRCLGAGELTITATAVSGASASVTVTVVDLAAFAGEVFGLVNAARAGAGTAAFSADTATANAAHARAEEIIILFARVRPDGREGRTALDDCGAVYAEAGEALACGQYAPAAVVSDWLASPPHRETLLNPAFGRAGAGVALDTDGVFYWVMVFAD